MHVSRRRLENSAKVVSKEKGGRNDRKRSNGTADWLGIKVDVSVPSACRLVPNSRKDVFNGIRRA